MQQHEDNAESMSQIEVTASEDVLRTRAQDGSALFIAIVDSPTSVEIGRFAQGEEVRSSSSALILVLNCSTTNRLKTYT